MQGLFFEDPDPAPVPAYVPGEPFPAEPPIPGDRLTPAILRLRKALRAGVKVSDSTPITADLAAFEAEMAVEPFEHFQYQQQQARAHALGRLTFAEAQVVYTALGEVGSVDNGGWAAGTDLATKVIVTEVMGNLVGLSRR